MDLSPWPLMCSLAVWVSASSVVLYLWKHVLFVYVLGALSVMMLGMCLWWRDVIRESTFQGEHTESVRNGIYIGMVLFIVSEAMFFFSFFFGYFFVCLNPDVVLGSNWPPVGVQAVSCISVPLFNTLLLLSSGVTITWAHHAVLSSSLSESVTGLTVTSVLGGIFIVTQANEYFETSFCLIDSSFGSLFFLITGFHGIHVLVGLVFIAVSTVRLMNLHFSSCHSVGLEVSVWYWHFVDVVWLFLFVSVYWWGG